jgi:soluble lytic murein transglycosylase-like protein
MKKMNSSNAFFKVLVRICFFGCSVVSDQAVAKATTVESAPALQNYTEANCWLESANLYGLDPYLLFAVAMVESGLNPSAINLNSNTSVDIGIMQINDSWLPTLRKYGITKQSLLRPCVSIQVGAWVMAQNFHRMGRRWEAIGAYNASSYGKRLIYARKVYLMYDRLKLWAVAYRDSYLKQYGELPAYTPKPPKEWLKFPPVSTTSR